jgi:putative transposase
MKILRAYRTELDPNQKQVTAMLQHAGAARWAYNWGLQKKIESYQATGKTPSAIDLHRELNLLKKKPAREGGVPWMYESSKCAPQEALRNLDKSYQAFFRRVGLGLVKKGFPRFKSRKRGIGGFRLTGSIRATETHIQLPNLGVVRIKEHGYLPTEGVRILSATVSEAAGRWFISIQVEQDTFKLTNKIPHIVGVDIGVNHLAVTSDGEFFENPKALIQAQRLLIVRQKSVSRKRKGSNNRRKSVCKLARLHQRISNIRKDAIHKVTTAITKLASIVVIESLNVSGMMKNHCLAKSLLDASLGEIHRQLRYKSEWSGVIIIEANRFYPSSKKCSRCGHIKEHLVLSDRVYHCDECGSIENRDFNAALNLKSLAPSSGVTACCPESSGLLRQAKLLVGQETNTGVASCQL